MGTATLQIAAATDHVRLARLVAGAAARRCGVDEEVLDEVRLAVGEACARAVVRAQAVPDAHVRIAMADSPTLFTVTVADQVADADENDDLQLAVIAALAPESRVETTSSGSTVDLAWPIATG